MLVQARIKAGLKSLFSYGLVIAIGLALGYLAALAPNWLKADYSEGNFGADFQASGTQVILFGTSTCPYCAETRKLLAAQNVHYADKDLLQDTQAQQRYAELGAKGVPVLLIGQRRIDGYKPQAIREALKLVKN